MILTLHRRKIASNYRHNILLQQKEIEKKNNEKFIQREKRR